MCTVRNETMIKVNKTKKLTELLLRLWLRKVLYGLDLLWQWIYALAVNTITKKIQLGNSKLAFGWVYDNSIFLKTFEYQLQMLLVFL